MSVTELKPTTKQNAETVVFLLEKLLQDAKEGRIVAFAGTVLLADRVHTMPVWSSSDAISAILGGVAFLQYSICLSASFAEAPVQG